jgi:hypothetical protein
MPPSLLRDCKLLLIALTLAFTVRDVLEIPFLNAPAVDLENLYLFHHCAGGRNPYLLDSVQCGDGFGRDMYYPPLLYFSFSWLRGVQFPFAAVAWGGFIAAALLVCSSAWIHGRAWRNLGAVRAWGLLFALLLQFPSAFAIERGNSDILPLIAWTVAFRLWLAGRPGWSGFSAGAAVAIKLYPGFASLIVGAGVFTASLRAPRRIGTLLLFGAGGIAAIGLAVLSFLPQTRDYVRDELPRFASYPAGGAAYSHTLKILDAWQPGTFYGASFVLVSSWLYASVRYLNRDPAVVFAGALAMSTYFANISFDYNLITSYPLLILMITRALDGTGRVALQNLTLSIFGILVLLGGRGIIEAHAWYTGRVALHVVWLSLATLVCPNPRESDGELYTRFAPLRN